jgi:capsular polysaccharide biosynthesis protein
MKHLSRFFIQLYPASWRRRYEAELGALLEDVHCGWRTSFDVLKGAVAMHLCTCSSGKIVTFAALLGLLVALGLWCAMPNQYVSTSLLKIESQQAANSTSGESAANEMIAWAGTVMSERSLGEIIEKRRLYPDKKGKIPLEDIVSEMKNNIRVRPAGTEMVSLEFKYVDPVLAQTVTGDLIGLFLDTFGDRVKPKLSTLEVLDAPSLTEQPVSPNAVRLAFLGLAGGVFVGVSVALGRRAPRIVHP